MADNFAELDFFANKENLKEFLKNQDRFKDYDFDGSNMSVLLDLLAYNTTYNNIYFNMAFSERFLDTAQIRESAVSRAKELNYVPRSTVSSHAVVQVEIQNVVGYPTFITLPKYSKFIGTSNNVSYTFTTDSTFAITANNGVYCSGNIPIYEGVIATEAFEVKSLDQRFILSNKKADTTSIALSVRENVDLNSNSTEYTVRESLFGVLSSDPVFYINEAENGFYEITFGKDVFGKQPIVGNVIEVSYRVASGAGANGIKSFSLMNAVEGYSTIVTTMNRSTGGADQESLESIKFFAPKSIQIQERTVTTNDYKILLKNKFPEITAISVYGGEELDPPRYGRTIISMAVNDMEGFSDNVRQRCLDYLDGKTVNAIRPVILAPEYMYVSVVSKVKYDLSKTSASEGYVKNIVFNAIKNYSKNKLSDFGKTLYLSNMSKEIDGSFDKIKASETKVQAIIPITPNLVTPNKYEILFKNELAPNTVITSGDDITDYVPCVSSSVFSIDGNSGYAMDDGKGNIHHVKNVNNTFTYVKLSIGSVDYKTGKIIINKENITSYIGSALEFYATPKYSDIVSPKSRILKIRDEDIEITVSGEYSDE